MKILCSDLTEVLLVCKYYDIPANPAEMVIEFPYHFEVDNGAHSFTEAANIEELSFEDFTKKYLNQ